MEFEVPEVPPGITSDPVIFQIYYRAEQLAGLDPGARPWDNTANPDPHLREYPIFKKIQEFAVSEGIHAWGVVSPRFSEKTNISIGRFKKWVAKNPGRQVYFINPCIILDGLYENVWLQGEPHHPGLCGLANSLLQRVGYKHKVESMIMSSDNFAFCNYFAATELFWEHYIEFVDGVLAAAEPGGKEYDLLYQGRANYSHDRSLSYYPFLVERLFSTFLWLHPWWSGRHYPFTAAEVSNKLTAEQYAVIVKLDRLKRKAYRHVTLKHDPDSLRRWQQSRAYFHRAWPDLYYKE